MTNRVSRTEYTVVSLDKVQDHLDAGWKIRGGIAYAGARMVSSGNGFMTEEHRLVQAMTRKLSLKKWARNVVARRQLNARIRRQAAAYQAEFNTGGR